VWQLVAVISGIIAGLAALFLGFLININLWSMPENLDGKNTASVEYFIKGLPDIFFITKIIVHALMCFLGGLIASLVANTNKAQAGAITILLLFSIVLYRDFEYVYPTLYVVCSLFAAGILGFFGVVIGTRR
jgi:hypothetical protein